METKNTIPHSDMIINTITEARHVLTALEKNMLYLLIGEVREGDPAGNPYNIDIPTLERVMGPITEDDFIQAESTLLGKRYTIIDTDDGIPASTSLISISEYEHVKEHRVLTLVVVRQVRDYYLKIKKVHTAFSFQIALGLSSIWAKRMYELCRRFLKQGKFSIGVTDLKIVLGVKNEKTGHDKYEGLKMFEHQVLQLAKTQLKKDADLTFEYQPIEKTGKKISALEFTIVTQPFALPPDSIDTRFLWQDSEAV